MEAMAQMGAAGGHGAALVSAPAAAPKLMLAAGQA